jgi:hypothetical protein
LSRRARTALAFAEEGLVEGRAETAVVTAVGRYFLRVVWTAFDAYLPAVSGPRPMAQAV